MTGSHELLFFWGGNCILHLNDRSHRSSCLYWNQIISIISISQKFLRLIILVCICSITSTNMENCDLPVLHISVPDLKWCKLLSRTSFWKATTGSKNREMLHVLLRFLVLRIRLFLFLYAWFSYKSSDTTIKGADFVGDVGQFIIL